MKKILFTIIAFMIGISLLSQEVLKRDLTLQKAAPIFHLNGIGATINFYNSDVTITHSSNRITVAGGDVALGLNNLLMTGSIGETGARVTKVWTTDVESTNMPTVGGVPLPTLINKTGEFNVLDYGAVADWNGSTGTDNTAAFQAAIDAMGTFKYTNPYLYLITSFGGGKVVIPRGRYKITGTLRCPGAILIEGAGLATEVTFKPTVSDTLFVCDPSKRSVGGTTTTQVKFKDMLITGDYNNNECIVSMNTLRLICDNLVIEGFKTGIYIGGTGGAAYYNEIRECYIRDCITNIYIGEGSAVTNIYGGIFTHSLAFTGAKYNIYTKSNGLTNILGSAIEGKVDSAQIFDGGTGLTIRGAYFEGAGGTDAPYILKKFNQSSIYGTYVDGFVNHIGSVKFENFDLVNSDGVGSQYQSRVGNSFKVGDAKFLPIIENGNLNSGDITGFAVTGGHGSIAFDTTHFRSFGSIKMTHSGDGGNNIVYYGLDSTDLKPYVGSRIYLTALIKQTATTTIELRAGGAGSGNKWGGPYVDYGNGWKLWELDIPVLNHTDPLYVNFTQVSSTASDSTYITNFQAFTDGFDYIPISRDVESYLPIADFSDILHDQTGVFNVLDYGAVGDILNDDTDAIQAAIDAAGYFAYTNPYYYLTTSAGGGIVEIPKGRYKITETLRYPAGVTIRGAGISTELLFRPTVSDTLFVANLNKSSKYTGVYRTPEQVRFENLLVTGDFNGNEGFWSVNTERLVFDNVTIEGFNTGIYIDGTGGEACYDVIRDCVIHDCITNIYLGEGARVITIIGGYFWHSTTFTGAKYNFNLKAQDVFIYGSSIEGKVDSAQIYDDGAGVTLVGVYHENRGGSTAPFILKNFRQSSTYGTTVLGMGNAMGDIQFKNFPLIVSDAIGTAYSSRMGNTFKMGDPKFLPIIDNGNLRSSDITLFPQIGAKNNGTVAYDSMRFRSHGSIKLKHDASASSDNGFYFQLDTTDLRAYLGARLYISILVNTTATATVTMSAFGAGNTVTKFAGDYVNYGNGWSLYALDIPIIDYQEALTVYVYQTSSVENDPTYVTCIQAFTDGFDIIPISRDVGGLLRIVPQATPPGTAYEGMIYMDTDHHIYVYNGTTWVQLDN